MNNKGYILTETLIVSAVVLTTLVLIYSQFARINNNYGDSFSYDDSNGTYILKELSNYFENNETAKLNGLLSSVTDYIDITDCSKFSNVDNCKTLIKDMEIKHLLLTFNNKIAVVGGLSLTDVYSIKFQNYVKTLNDTNQDYGYRLIAEFEDGTFSTGLFGSKLYSESILNGTDPIVSEGMIPVVIADDGTVKKANRQEEWYNYEEKQWANVVLVSKDNRIMYQEAAPDTEINSSDILAYFVWVPRYKYQLFSSTTPIEIKIQFENKNTTKSSSTTVGEWLTHPAFTFGDEELNGIWVGKFETTGTIDNPTVLPNVSALRKQNVSSEFVASLKFSNHLLNQDGTVSYLGVNNTYGIQNVDSHMAKNSEWGAVSYLSQSKYGRCTDGVCTEISRNNSPYYTTGLGVGSLEPIYDGPIYTFNTDEGGLSSTTGNLTGIYDMSGGAWEYVMGNYNGELGSSGFSTLPEGKYYQTYTGTDATTGCNGGICYGDSLSETTGWYDDDDLTYVNSSYPWFTRGGYYYFIKDAGINSFSAEIGSEYSYCSFRTIITN